VPDGIRLVFLPPYTPELQPAETLWVHVDEPLANRHFETPAELEAVVAGQCVALHADRNRIRGQAGFHWWPAKFIPNLSAGCSITTFPVITGDEVLCGQVLATIDAASVS